MWWLLSVTIFKSKFLCGIQDEGEILLLVSPTVVNKLPFSSLLLASHPFIELISQKDKANRGQCAAGGK